MHSAGFTHLGRGLAAAAGIAIAVAGTLVACKEQPSVLEQVRDKGELIVVTRNSPTTYYEGPHGFTGLEYELASRFADYLGVDLTIAVPDSFSDILPMVSRGEAHLAAAGLTVTQARKERVRFGPPYQEITQQLVYRSGAPRPRGLEDLLNGPLEVVAGSSHAERLRILKEGYPDLAWNENPELDSEELLYLVWEDVIDYTVADSNEVALNRRFYPELRVAFDLTDPQPLAWAFPRGQDDTLFNAAERFFRKITKSGELSQLIERHYGHVKDFDYVGTRAYLRHVEQRLPEFRPLFEQAGEAHEVDWRLLAAVGYQESHWNPRAKSPTGVRGIMMLTRTTAKQLGIKNRLDPEKSIQGGARYLTQLRERIPSRIAEPDRTWLALAAYNVGFGHLEDARILTETRGGDPDKWMDIKKNLPLLSQRRWYKKTRHGYARGREPVRYVENIRSYYDILVWMTERREPPVERKPEALFISSPVL